ncbi:MAG: bifunctional 5,10-methylenetetrahydrofolate dehydrogenase/5,10-methenyltetrahydrofolate cyclohydrolase [SAR202 cluster bacterium]|jgi:methylenetetrahydrofolate dehydrogenase (NADP+)/methenyltetrahydrofolate cyclohydrolase|nr:bifunctional 5,10-methylenetetrahydrofolate dehydrogenase/5,10-methenyltetrahydrofolate cyclohydrolase [SAR202 cluster bacterium]|tara:strand:+ start:3176 stop:4060 length:885 start_codon:yes stop_codon:yes gene_type:complete
MDTQVINGVELAAEIRLQILDKVKILKKTTGIIPGLSVILVGNDPASNVYVKSKQKAAIEIGMNAVDYLLPETVKDSDVIQLIKNLNSDESVHGILVQLPLPENLSKTKIIDSIDPNKDVDGLHTLNMGKLMTGRQIFPPATPYGIQKILLSAGVSVSSKHVVVLGRSEIVGKPISLLMSQKGVMGDATVTVCHSKTRNIESITNQADILIAAIGMPNFVTGSMVKDGVVVIDVGINRVVDAQNRRGYKLVGDVFFEEVSKKASVITPVPGGVGPMTIAMLLENTFKSASISSL